MNVLVINAGSSTLKFELISTDLERIKADADETLAEGIIERIGGEAVIAARAGDGPRRRTTARLRDLEAGVEWILRWLTNSEGTGVNTLGDIQAAGHRVVHGGERFRKSVLLDETVMQEIEDMIELAPLHNPYNIQGIEAVKKVLGEIPQAAVFDTSFHHTLPERSFLYAIPYSFYRRHKIRRYGFHGTSHRYVAHRYRQLTGTSRDDTTLVTLHLGNGSSACAIREGHSVDTSMGFTPLEGLVMGTRSGDLDPAILEFLGHKEGLDAGQVETLLNKQSGLLGISGLTHDMRELLAEAADTDDRRAHLAVEIFAYRARKYIGAYVAALGGADAVVLAGGIGENSPYVRARVLEGLDWLGLELDQEANEEMKDGREGRISCEGSRLEAWVIHTNEELLIARDTVRLVEGAPVPH